MYDLLILFISFLQPLAAQNIYKIWSWYLNFQKEVCYNKCCFLKMTGAVNVPIYTADVYYIVHGFINHGSEEISQYHK